MTAVRCLRSRSSPGFGFLNIGFDTIESYQKITRTMSTPPHDYIFFADDRSSIPTSTMHIADQIAKSNRVFWVNIYTRLPKLSEFKKALRILTRRGARAAVNQQDTGSTILSATPIQFPWF